jgi:hypothetical protein
MRLQELIDRLVDIRDRSAGPSAEVRILFHDEEARDITSAPVESVDDDNGDIVNIMNVNLG